MKCASASCDVNFFIIPNGLRIRIQTDTASAITFQRGLGRLDGDSLYLIKEDFHSGGGDFSFLHTHV